MSGRGEEDSDGSSREDYETGCSGDKGIYFMSPIDY